MPANISAPKHHGTRRRQSCDVTGRTRFCGIFPVRASQQLTIGELLLTQLKLNALRRPARLDAEQGAASWLKNSAMPAQISRSVASNQARRLIGALSL
jgi:hypothetical protein